MKVNIYPILTLLTVVVAVAAPQIIPPRSETIKRGLMNRVAQLEVANPPGTVIAFAGVAIPEGYLDCDGSEQDVTEYPELYAAIKDTYAVGQVADGKFCLPNLSGRVVVGDGKKRDAGITARNLGDRFGEERHLLTLDEMPRHDHEYRQSPHYHGDANRKVGGTTVGGSNTGILDRYIADGGAGGASWSVVVTTYTEEANINFVSQGKNLSHNVIQPSLALKYLIKY